ncbi:MAG: ABC transporter ATP-binding protein [Candidatus Heimdallarchaeota archaeon]
MTTVLEAKNVSMWFGGLQALNDVSTSVKEHEIVGLIGPNGAGKTTLLNCITGFYKPVQGCIFYKGEEITGLKPNQICKMGVAKTFQIIRAFKSLSVLDNVLIGALLRTNKIDEAQSIAREAIEKVRLQGKENIIAGNLTPTDQRFLELARALSTRADVLLLDEIAAGLNPSEISELVETLKEINQGGLTLIIVEHVMQAIMPIAERIIVLHGGSKIAEGAPEEIKSNKKVIEAYLGEEE